MNNYKTMITEQRPAKGIVREDGGVEVISNDNDIRILLGRKVVFDGFMEKEYYVSDYYIQEDGGWLKTDTHNTYASKEEFLRAIENTEEFTQAMEDIEQWKQLL